MASRTSNDDSLSGSWVELGSQSVSPLPVRATSGRNYSVERLLREAQRECSLSTFRAASVTSSTVVTGSPPCTPNSDLATNASNSDVAQLSQHGSDYMDTCGVVNTDWVWDWSSRPEVVPPSDHVSQLKHPPSRWKNLSIRNTRVMDFIIFSIENLPILLFTHACTFVFGAATMLIVLKKCFKCSSLVAPAVD